MCSQRQVQGVLGEYSLAPRAQGTDPTPLLGLDHVISNNQSKDFWSWIKGSLDPNDPNKGEHFLWK